MGNGNARGFALMQRSLTPAEAQCVHQELKSTPNILGYTKRELLRLRDVWVVTSEGRLAGVCASVNLPAQWTEIMFLYVLPAFRGQGLGKRLFDEAWNLAQRQRRHIYVLSRNPQVIGWMSERGMTISSRFWAAPWPVQWHMHRHMTSWYRCREQLRKWREIRQCPSLKQGISLAKSETPLWP